MTIEEKAKAYDKAIERTKYYLTNIGVSPDEEPIDVAKKMSEYIFPQLYESEDEKIRKHLICLFKKEYGNNSSARFAGIKVKDIIAWLEKRDEQKHTTPKFKVGDMIRHIKEGITCKIDSIDTEYRVSGCNGTHLPFDAEDYWELVEQESVEWSEEDEKILKEVVSILRNNLHPSATERMRLAVKLDSLRPPKHWKPSEEQMKALNSLLLKGGITEVGQAPCLQSLYIDLKAL